MSNFDNADILLNLPSVLPIITLTHPQVYYPFVTERFTCIVEEQAHLPVLMEDICSSGNFAVFIPTKPGTQFPHRTEDLYSIAVVASITEMEQKNDTTFRCLARGLERVTIGTVVQEKPYFKAQIRLNPPQPGLFDDEMKRLYAEVLGLARRLYAIIGNTTEDKVLTNFLPILQPREIYAASSLLAYILQNTASADWSSWQGKHTLQMDAELRLQLLTCNSDIDRFTLLRNFLESEVPLFEADKQQTGEKTSQKSELKGVTALEISEESHAYDTLLGKNIKTGEQVWLKPWEFSLGGYFVGKRRSGKSTLLENIITRDIKLGRCGMMVIDPHSDLLTKIINRIKQERLNKGNGDILLLDPKDYQHPFGLNIYHCEDKNDPLAVDYTVNLVLHLFQKLWPSDTSQPLVEDVIRNSAYTIIANDATMVEIPSLLFNERYRETLLENVTDPYVLQFWEEYNSLKPADREVWAGPLGRRIRRFTSSPIIRNIVGQKKTLPLKQIMDTKKIVLVRLDAAMEELTTLIGSVLIGQLLQAALSRSETDDRPEFHLYCDEYARFATSDFATIISECGKYNVIPFIAHLLKFN